jgi:colanic acid biosynthesis glycosyl transferase WcaI
MNSRVFFVNRYFHPDESATSQLLSDLAFCLTQHGYEVHVICSRQLYGAAKAKLPAHEKLAGVTVHRLWTTRFGRAGLPGRALDYLSFHLSCAATLLLALRRADIIVAKTDPPLISIVAWISARLKRATLINWLQDVFPEVAAAIGVKAVPAVMERLLCSLRDASLRAAVCNVVLGERMRDYLAGRLGAAATFKLIENWADDTQVQVRAGADSALRDRLGLDGKFVVGYSGNLGRGHEYETIVAAAEALKADDTFVFLFIGGGVKMDALKVSVRERGLNNFKFLPYQPRSELTDSLAAADVHLVSLLPSLEGLIVPSKIYGILAAARPVVFIGDPDGEVARIIRQSRCGSDVAVGDSRALTEMLKSLQHDVAARRRMGAAGRSLLLSRFSKERAMSSWLALLRGIQTTRIDSR